MTENKNWPPKHHGEHNPEGRTGHKDWDKPGLKGREDETYAQNAMSYVSSMNLSNFIGNIAKIFTFRKK